MERIGNLEKLEVLDMLIVVQKEHEKYLDCLALNLEELEKKLTGIVTSLEALLK